MANYNVPIKDGKSYLNKHSVQLNFMTISVKFWNFFIKLLKHWIFLYELRQSLRCSLGHLEMHYDNA